MHFEHSEKRRTTAAATDRLSPGAGIIVIGLCSLAAWGSVLWLGATLLRVVGL
jgi:hypothetical protein